MTDPKKEVVIIPLKKGIEILHACKMYTHKTGIPEEIHKEIYGNTGKDEAEKKKIYAIKLKKHKATKEEPVKDEPKSTGK